MKKMLISSSVLIAFALGIFLQLSSSANFEELVFKRAYAQGQCNDEKDTHEICAEDESQCYYENFCDVGESDCTPYECSGPGGGIEM